MRAVIDGDLVVGTSSGDSDQPMVPDNLRSVPLGALRYINGAFSDCRQNTDWFIDAIGRKHKVNAEGRQSLVCSWDAKLVKVDSEWRVKTAADILAPQIKRECTDRIRAVLKDDATQRNLTAYFLELTARMSIDGEDIGQDETADFMLLRAARQWVIDMQNACRALVVAADDTYEDDSHWPAVPTGLADLANRF